MESLLEGVLEDVLLRLPYADLVHGKQVCRRWKALTESSSFRRAYRDSVKWICHYGSPHFYELVDSSNSTLRWRETADFFDGTGGITSGINGLMLVCSSPTLGEQRQLYICNIFTSKRHQVPHPGKGFLASETAIFDIDRRYKLVNWRDTGEIWTLEDGQPQWSEVTQASFSSYSNLLVVGSSIFRVDYEAGTLMEYSVIPGRLSSTAIIAKRRKGDSTLGSGREIGNALLMLWEGDVYLVVSYYGDEEEQDDADPVQVVELLRVSLDTGCATLVDEFEMLEPLDCFDSAHMTAEGALLLLHIEGDMDEDNSKVSVVYNMSTRTVQNRTVSDPRKNCSETTVVPLRLYDW